MKQGVHLDGALLRYIMLCEIIGLPNLPSSFSLFFYILCSVESLFFLILIKEKALFISPKK